VRDIEVVWIMKHQHIGDAFFDVDAAEFLLGELQHQQPVQHQQRVQQQQQQQQRQQPVQQQQQDVSGGLTAAQPTLPQQLSASPNSKQQQQQQQQQEGCAEASQAQQLSAAGLAAGTQAHKGTLVAAAPTAAAARAAPAAAAGALEGHAAGPKWVDSLPKGGLPANVRLERHALVSPRGQSAWILFSFLLCGCSSCKQFSAAVSMRRSGLQQVGCVVKAADGIWCSLDMPCSLESPTHMWIVVRTLVAGTAALP